MQVGTRTKRGQGIKISELPSSLQEENLVALLDLCEETGRIPSLKALQQTGLGEVEYQVLSRLKEKENPYIAEAVDDFCTCLQSIVSLAYQGNTDFYESLSTLMEKELAWRKEGIIRWKKALDAFSWKSLKFSSRTACREVYTRIVGELQSKPQLKTEMGEDVVQRDRYLQEVLSRYIAEKRTDLSLAGTPLSSFSSAVQEKVKEAIFPTSEEVGETRDYMQLSCDLADFFSRI